MLMFFDLAANSRSEFQPERLAAIAMQCNTLSEAEAQAIAQTTGRALDAGIKRIEVDMENVRTINSAALSLLVESNRRAQAQGSYLVLVNISREAHAVLTILGADGILEFQN